MLLGLKTPQKNRSFLGLHKAIHFALASEINISGHIGECCLMDQTSTQLCRLQFGSALGKASCRLDVVFPAVILLFIPLVTE